MIDFSKGFPPPDHDERLKRYLKYEQLFRSEHRAVFQPHQRPNEKNVYNITNLARSATLLSSDILFGEPFDILAKTEANKDALKTVANKNKLSTLLYECGLGQSYRGDAVLKARWGKRCKYSQRDEVIIEAVPPSIYFPDFNPDNTRQVDKVYLAYLKPGPPSEPTVQYLRVEEHEPGKIYQRLYRTADGKLEEVDLKIYPEYAELQPEVETELEVIPVFYVPNFRDDKSFWGISDYEGIESNLEERNARQSQNSRILTKHADPKALVPESLVDEDGKIDIESMDFIKLSPADQKPEMLVWDPQLDASFKEIDQLNEDFFILTETAPAGFGLDKFGVAESGRALKLRMQRTLAKVARKRRYWEEALKELFGVAQVLEQKFGNASYTPEEVELQWPDGLPGDLVEAVQIETQAVAGRITSRLDAARRLYGEEAAEKTQAQIATEEDEDRTFTGAGSKLERTAPSDSSDEDSDEQE